jgi:hypothetical protein
MSDMTGVEQALNRIADALEALAQAEVPEMRNMEKAFATAPDEGYARAVQAIIDMPDDVPPEPVIPVDPVTRQDVVDELNRFAKVHGMSAAKNIIAQFGEGLSAIDPGKYGEVIDMLKKVK